MALPSTLARPPPWSISMSLTPQSHSPAHAELPCCACSPALCPSCPFPLGACCGPRTWFSPQFCSCQAKFHRLSLAGCQCGPHPTVLPSWACRLLHRTLAPWCYSAAWFPGDPGSLVHVSSVLGLPPGPQGRPACAVLSMWGASWVRALPPPWSLCSSPQLKLWHGGVWTPCSGAATGAPRPAALSLYRRPHPWLHRISLSGLHPVHLTTLN